MTPPPAEELIPRLFLGPALRAQSDRRLVRLVRDGYEAAFDEIMRRYGVALRRYAGALVGGRAEDVTQEAFSKALQAIRRNETEIELRPWLYRIVRNTALNDIRDRHPATLALADGIPGHHGVAEEVERREEMAELTDRLRALPEHQRAAIVMRELEGLGHDEIAAALGISDGAARQAIHRARTALRDGLGMAIPLPLLRAMLESGAAVPTAEIAAGGAGTGIVLKAATATVLVAGTFGAGVALHQGNRASHQAKTAHEAIPAPRIDPSPPQVPPAVTDGSGDRRHSGSGGGSPDGNAGEDRGMPSHGGPGSPTETSEGGHSRSGPSSSGHSGRGGDSGEEPTSSGESHSGPDVGSSSDGRGPSGETEPGGSSGPGPGTPEAGGEVGSGSNSGSGSSGGGPGSGESSGPGPGSEGSRDSPSGGGLSQQESQPEEDR
jgi:RNA polymerase sigma factor (sigma-70 family)